MMLVYKQVLALMRSIENKRERILDNIKRRR